MQQVDSVQLGKIQFQDQQIVAALLLESCQRRLAVVNQIYRKPTGSQFPAEEVRQ